MRKLFIALILLCALIVNAFAEEIDLAATPEPAETPHSSVQISEDALLDAPPIELCCAATLLVEAQSGQILFSMNADLRRPVASVTKVMTILLALEAIEQGRISREQQTTISAEAAGMGGSQVLLDVGEIQTVDVLLKSTIVGSANDACVALAELMYGSEELCVKQMNCRAEELGMRDTHFVNCTGLPADDQYTTAHDVAIMAMAMLSHELYYEYSDIWMDEVQHDDGRVTQLTNTNKLIRQYTGCDGGKTGSTDQAGYCMAATAKRGDMRIVAVVLGADSGKERFRIASDMLDYAFANYRLYPVAQRGTKIRGRLSVDGGRPDSIQLMLSDDLTLLVGKGEEQNITLSPMLPDRLTAPVAQGDVVGYVGVVQNDREIARINVIAAEESKAAGMRGNLLRLLNEWCIA